MDPVTYTFNMNLKEVIKTVHKLKHEMNMLTPNDCVSTNYTNIFRDICPNDCVTTHDGEMYSLTIDKDLIEMFRTKTFNETITVIWAGKIYKCVNVDEIKCTFVVHEFDGTIDKFLPIVKMKMDNCCDLE